MPRVDRSHRAAPQRVPLLQLMTVALLYYPPDWPRGGARKFTLGNSRRMLGAAPQGTLDTPGTLCAARSALVWRHGCHARCKLHGRRTPKTRSVLNIPSGDKNTGWSLARAAQTKDGSYNIFLLRTHCAHMYAHMYKNGKQRGELCSSAL